MVAEAGRDLESALEGWYGCPSFSPKDRMAGFQTTYDIECSEETYWDKVFLDEEYNRRFFREELHFPEWRELWRKEVVGKLQRNVKATPYVGELPGPLKAVIGDGLSYEERGVFDRQNHRYELEAVPSRMADKVTTKITMFTTVTGEGRCRLHVEATVTARIFVVGTLLEQKTLADLRRSYEKNAAFSNRYVSENGLK
jgi:hypothetical protein